MPDYNDINGMLLKNIIPFKELSSSIIYVIYAIKEIKFELSYNYLVSRDSCAVS